VILSRKSISVLSAKTVKIGRPHHRISDLEANEHFLVEEVLPQRHYSSSLD